MRARGVKRPAPDMQADSYVSSDGSDEEYQQPVDASSDDDDGTASLHTESSDGSPEPESEPSDDGSSDYTTASEASDDEGESGGDDTNTPG